MCAGTTYQTYYTEIEVSSGNTSVAKASYSSGSIKIQAISPGSATISVTGRLRQFNKGTASIQVEVTEKAAETTTKAAETTTKAAETTTKAAETTAKITTKAAETTTKASDTAAKAAESTTQNAAAGTQASNSQSSSGGIAVSPVQSSTASAAQTVNGTTVSAESSLESSLAGESVLSGEITGSESGDSASSSIQSEKGRILFVPIQSYPIGLAELTEIQGQEAYVVFQMQDSSNTVLYSWELYGQKVLVAFDMNYSIEITKQESAGGQSGNMIWLQFAETGEFPAEAQINIRVEDVFSAGQMVVLYQHNGDGQAAVKLQEGLQTENGYIGIQLSHGGTFYLMEEVQEASSLLVPILILAVILPVMAGFLWILKTKGKKAQVSDNV